MPLGNLKLGGLPTGRKEQLTGYVKMLLLWVAASDGNVDDTELEFAVTRFPDADGEIKTKDLLAVIREADLVSLEKAIRAVAAENRELRIAFLDLAITMSMADQEIAVTEHHILRFYADALYLGTDLLKRRFEAIAGRPWFEPGDPGDPAWWEQAGAGTLDSGDQRQKKIDAVKNMLQD
jgi:uncharacterized tellurite resistance protein B-like protein